MARSPTPVQPHLPYAEYANTWGVASDQGRIVLSGGPRWTSGPKPHWHVAWRSVRQYKILRTTHYFDEAAVGPHAVAFSLAPGWLYVAPRGVGGERLIARREDPVGWTGHGLVVGRWHHGETLLLRHADGSLARTLVSRVRDSTFDPTTRTLLYVARGGDLIRTDGVRSSVVAGPRVVGNPRGLTIDVLEHGMIGLVSTRRVVVLDRNGRLFAAPAILKTATGRLGQLSTYGVVESPNGQAVAYSVADRRGGSASVGPESILLLRRGDRSPTVLATKTMSFAVCERGADLTWHGSWILYHSTEGEIVAIDSTRRHVPINLSRIARHLPGTRSYDGGHWNLEVAWGSAQSVP